MPCLPQCRMVLVSWIMILFLFPFEACLPPLSLYVFLVLLLSHSFSIHLSTISFLSLALICLSVSLYVFAWFDEYPSASIRASTQKHLLFRTNRPNTCSLTHTAVLWSCRGFAWCLRRDLYWYITATKRELQVATGAAFISFARMLCSPSKWSHNISNLTYNISPLQASRCSLTAFRPLEGLCSRICLCVLAVLYSCCCFFNCCWCCCCKWTPVRCCEWKGTRCLFAISLSACEVLGEHFSQVTCRWRRDGLANRSTKGMRE